MLRMGYMVSNVFKGNLLSPPIQNLKGDDGNVNRNKVIDFQLLILIHVAVDNIMVILNT